MRPPRPPVVLAVLAVVTGAVVTVLAVIGGTGIPTPSDPGSGGATLAAPVPTPSTPSAPATSPATPDPTGEGTAAPSVAPAPPGRASLERRLAAVVESPGLRRREARLGIVVRDEAGRTLLDVGGDTPLLPASTQKLVTAAASLGTFRPGHRLVTTVGATTRSRSGTVVGTLVLTGAGDPVLATEAYERHVYPIRPRTPLEELADDIAGAGVGWVTGGIVGDPSVLAGADTAPGWPARYLRDFDARRIHGLTVDAGLTVGLEGPEDAPELELRQAADPARHAAAELARLLRERGVTVSGEIRSTADAPATTELLGSVRSPPLRELLRHMVERSDNHLADTLFRLVGAARGGDGSWASGARAAHEVLADLGVDAGGAFLVDGSGLSRHNRLSARLLADLDAAMMAGAQADVWRSLMAVAGREGTLRRRLTDTVADGAFRGKTGTLDDVTAVAGTVEAPDGSGFHLAVIGNDAGTERWTVRVLADELVLALAEDQRGCTRRPSPAPSPSPSPTPPHVETYELVCPG